MARREVCGAPGWAEHEDADCYVVDEEEWFDGGYDDFEDDDEEPDSVWRALHV
jgi:hypothetical protein